MQQWERDKKQHRLTELALHRSLYALRIFHYELHRFLQVPGGARP